MTDSAGRLRIKLFKIVHGKLCSISHTSCHRAMFAARLNKRAGESRGDGEVPACNLSAFFRLIGIPLHIVILLQHVFSFLCMNPMAALIACEILDLQAH